MLFCVEVRGQAWDKRSGSDAAPPEETVIDRLHRRLNTITNQEVAKAYVTHSEFGTIFDANHGLRKKQRRKVTDPNEFEKWQHEQIVERLKWETTIQRI